jgi:hypothetical protein
MHIVTPTEITSIAWEGELTPPEIMRSSLQHTARPVVTLGQRELWPAGKALETEVGKKWTPPLSDADFYLLRLACTLREPSGDPTITEATETLYLRPKNSAAGERAAYAHSLFPDRVSVEGKAEFGLKLSPELKLSGTEVKVGEAGVTIEYRQVFPVIQGYGVGEPTPYWIFRPHAAFPLDGSQYVYAVIAAAKSANGARAFVELTVTVQSKWGPVRYGLPEEAQAHTSFTIP